MASQKIHLLPHFYSGFRRFADLGLNFIARPLWVLRSVFFAWPPTFSRDKN